MAYSNVKARLLVHAQTAAAAVTPAIEDVQAGFSQPRSDCVRVYYGGEAEPARLGRFTLGNEHVGKRTWIELFLPLTGLDEELAATVDARAEAFGHALRSAVDADQDLATAGDNTVLGFADPSVDVFGNARWLTCRWEALTDYIEYTLAK